MKIQAWETFPIKCFTEESIKLWKTKLKSWIFLICLLTHHKEKQIRHSKTEQVIVCCCVHWCILDDDNANNEIANDTGCEDSDKENCDLEKKEKQLSNGNRITRRWNAIMNWIFDKKDKDNVAWRHPVFQY